MSDTDPQVLLLIEEPSRLVVLVDPEWQRKVASRDHEFVASIIADFAIRAITDPTDLFAEARNLNVGPLVTKCSDFLRQEAADLRDTIDHFVPAVP